MKKKMVRKRKPKGRIGRKKTEVSPTLFDNKNGTPDQLDVKTLEGWLREAACSIRGAVDAPKFKDYILPLIFVKRLSDVFEDEVNRVAEKFGDEKTARDLIGDDHSLVRFYISPRLTNHVTAMCFRYDDLLGKQDHLFSTYINQSSSA